MVQEESPVDEYVDDEEQGEQEEGDNSHEEGGDATDNDEKIESSPSEQSAITQRCPTFNWTYFSLFVPFRLHFSSFNLLPFFPLVCNA